jgi:hypothetical protein
MRSPWQILKSFASRGKADEAQAQPDEALSLPEPGNVVLPDKPAFTPDLATPDEPVNSPVEDTEAPLTGHVKAEPTEPLPETKAHAGDEGLVGVVTAPDETSQSKTFPTKPANPNADALPGAVKKAGKPTWGPTLRAEPSASSRSAEAPVAAERTAFEQAIALDDEIHELRAQLSDKLRKQNSQMKLLLDRYDNGQSANS